MGAASGARPLLTAVVLGAVAVPAAGSYVMTDSTIRYAVAAWLSDSAAAEVETAKAAGSESG